MWLFGFKKQVFCCLFLNLLPVSQGFVLNPITTESEPEGYVQQVGLGGYSAVGREDADALLWEGLHFLCTFWFSWSVL